MADVAGASLPIAHNLFIREHSTKKKPWPWIFSFNHASHTNNNEVNMLFAVSEILEPVMKNQNKQLFYLLMK